MLKRFNMLLLIVLLVFQTMITPVAVTAQGVEQETDNTVTTEDVGGSDDVDTSEEVGSTENDGLDVDEEESDGEGIPGEDTESGDETNVSGDDPDADPETTDIEWPY